MFDALIFDIDGTLWNASGATARGWNEGLESLGIEVRLSAEQIESVAGKPFKECVELLLPGQLEEHPSLFNVLDMYEQDVIKSDGGVFYQGVLPGIRKLSRDFPIFLVSNCQEWYLQLFLKFSRLGPFLTDCSCHGMVLNSKSEMISSLVSRYSLRNAVYIGDTADDEGAAEAAHVTFIHASYGFGKPGNTPLSVASFHQFIDFITE